jgi:branched-chain amino acid transport system substrate-binding protein
VSQEPNFILWAEQVNAAGGLSVKGTRRRVELFGYDDRRETETVVRTYEKLMGSDKVDLILPPWGTGANFAVLPLIQKYGHPMLAPTATGRKLLDFKNPYFFAMLQQPDRMMGALADFLAAQGVKTAAVVYVDELFGLENLSALEPVGVKDLSPVLRDFKSKNPDAFLGITYPPDTFLVTGQSKEVGFNLKVFYAAVGSAFPVYKQRMGEGARRALAGPGAPHGG